MGTSKKAMRGLVALGLVAGLVVAACGSSAKSGANGNNGNNGNNGGGSGSLTSGLSSNLDKLDSYQFAWAYTASSASATAKDSGGYQTSGTVINKPTKSYKVNNLGMVQVIVIGSEGWVSYDQGATWMVDTTYATDSGIKSLLPDSLYGSNFDSNSGDFSVAGEETKNGVKCVHFTGSSSLGAAGAILGADYSFRADLWISKDGNFPVSGFYGWTGTSGGQSSSFGYSFDISHVNDSANKVDRPTNVQAAPSF